jgi:hypothetical protein
MNTDKSEDKRAADHPKHHEDQGRLAGAAYQNGLDHALNCWPWVWSLTHSPEAVIHSPAEIMAAWPITVTRSRCPRALTRRTQKPLSLLWKVTRSTRPARTYWVEGSG